MDSKHRGAYSELIASTYLLSLGYEVFRNVSQHGPADLVAWNPKTNETIFIDVKSGHKYRKTDGSTSIQVLKKPSKFNVKLLVVCDNECFWREDL